MCRRVLMDDVNFTSGYPKSIKMLTPSRHMTDVSNAEHKQFRRQIIAPIVGNKALEMFLERVEDVVLTS
ncbi:hypothetical protein RYX36_016365, partial [Vicia faba]